MVQRIAVLICCFNRKAQTLACLARLCLQQVDTTFPFALSIYLLDNGNDGTLQAVTEQFPQVCTRKGQADWYWNTGMRQLWLPILDDNHDFVLWLNDDVQLDFDAVSRLLSCYHQEQFAYQNQLTRRASVGAIIGAMREPITHKQQPEPELSYGGRNRVSAWHPSAFGPLLPISSRNVDCDFINGNFCLIPKASVEKVGILSAEYTHGMGDYDYGHRLQQAGYRLIVAAGSYGDCASHPFASSIYNAAQPFQERLVKLKLPNVLPPVVEWRRYLRQHGGAIWPLLWFKTYIRQWFPWLWLWLRQSHKPMREQRLKKVLIVQPMFKQYRLEFFQHLNENLKQHGIELVFCYSEPIPAEALKADNLVNTGMSFTKLVPYKKIGPFFWQSLPDFANFELVVVEQANKYVQNWLLLARRCLGLKPILAYWGHGFNHQHRHGWKELIKRKVVARADGFFAYTKPVADYVVSQGFPEKHTFILNNSIDTKEFAKLVDSRRLINPQKVKLVLIFCSALYHDKQIPLLLKTAKHLFDLGIIERLIVLGQGPLQDLCLEQANETWLDYRGACFAEQKAQAFAEADVMFHPGLVGLVILDAFAAGLPFVTTDFPGHSPEIAYLEPGKNGLQVPMTEQALVEAIIKLQQDRALLATLSAGALASSKLYTVEAMAESFANGVVELLAVREKK